jgi:hypothetical protein
LSGTHKRFSKAKQSKDFAIFILIIGASMKELKQISETLERFAKKRDWNQFHSPKNLSMALSVEVAELVEEFQWLTEEHCAPPGLKSLEI